MAKLIGSETLRKRCRFLNSDKAEGFKRILQPAQTVVFQTFARLIRPNLQENHVNARNRLATVPLVSLHKKTKKLTAIMHQKFPIQTILRSMKPTSTQFTLTSNSSTFIL